MSRYLRWGIVLSWAILVFVNIAGFQTAGAAGPCTNCIEDSSPTLQFTEIREYTNNNALDQLFSPVSNGVDNCPTTFEEQVILLINIERSNVGLPPLTLDIRLQSPARWFSNDIAVNGIQAAPHEGSDGSTPGSRATAAGYPTPFVGETLIAGTGSFVNTPEKAVQGWMDSAGHKAILLGNTYVHIGVGHTNAAVPPNEWENTVIADFGPTGNTRVGPPSNCDPGFFQARFPFVTK